MCLITQVKTSSLNIWITIHYNYNYNYWFLLLNFKFDYLYFNISKRNSNLKGGNVTYEDFEKYKAFVREPITVQLDENYKIFTPPLPSSGMIIILIMKIMKGLKRTPNRLV